MSIVDSDKMEKFSRLYKPCKDVTREECPMAKSCGTCMYSVYSQSSDRTSVCVAVKMKSSRKGKI